jgi:spermidine synthase
MMIDGVSGEIPESGERGTSPFAFYGVKSQTVSSSALCSCWSVHAVDASTQLTCAKESGLIPWKLLDKVAVPGKGGELSLFQRGSEFSMRINKLELMNSCAHRSEELLAELACARIADRAQAKVLIGGLGMGFTAAAALRSLPPDGEVVVAELVPAVIRWNRHEFAGLTGNALNNDRISIQEIDIIKLLHETRPRTFDAILLDIDNGPKALVRQENDWLYSAAGLAMVKAILRRKGVLAVWSAGLDKSFTKQLHAAGFEAQEMKVSAQGEKSGNK